MPGAASSCAAGRRPHAGGRPSARPRARACMGRKPWNAKKKDVQLEAPTYQSSAMVTITTVNAEMVRLACTCRGYK